MKHVNTKELGDYLYCPHFWFRRKSNHEYDREIDLDAQRKRYDKRKRRYELYQKLKADLDAKKRKAPKRRKRYTRRKRQDWSMIILAVLIVTFLVLKSYVSYMILAGCLIGLARWILTRWKKWAVFVLEKQLDPHRLLRKELQANPSLILYDFSESPHLYSELDVIYDENHRFCIQLDRSKEKVPGYLRLAKKSDLIELAACMKIFHAHFFTDRFVGQIKYQNDTKTIYWSRDKKPTQKITALLSEVGDVVRQMEGGYHKNAVPLPYRCIRCPIQKECPSRRGYPNSRPSGDEAPEKVFEKFLEAKSKLLSTSKKHWQSDAKELWRRMQSSSTLQKIIKKSCTSGRIFDIEELIETAAFHKKRLYNTTLSQRDEFAFAYQLLQHIVYKGRSFRQSTMEQLAGAYGNTKWYDYRTHSDQLIRSFFKTTFERFLTFLQSELQKQVPKEKMDQIIFNLNKSQLNIATDQGLIRAEMHVEDAFDDEEASEEDRAVNPSAERYD